MNRQAASLRFRIHPLFVLLFAASVAVGMWIQVSVWFGLVLLHELGHAAAATFLGYKVMEVQLLPFGGVVKLAHGRLGWNPKHEVWIAIAGPCVNGILLFLLAFASVLGTGSREWRTYLIEFNLILLFFNLLPGLPLDGGRILRAAAAAEVGFLRATEVASKMAIFLSLVMMVVGVSALWMGYLNVGMTTLGLFLFLSSLQLRKHRQYDLIRFLDAKRNQIKQGPLVGRGLIADPDMTVVQIAGEFVPDAYHMISIFSTRHQEWKTLSEDDILTVMFDGSGPQTKLSQLL